MQIKRLNSKLDSKLLCYTASNREINESTVELSDSLRASSQDVEVLVCSNWKCGESDRRGDKIYMKSLRPEMMRIRLPAIRLMQGTSVDPNPKGLICRNLPKLIR